jgi:myosin heavy subunit
VEYDPAGFVEKNSDPVDPNINKILSKSSLSILANLFKYEKPKGGAAPKGGGLRKSVAASSQLGKQTICNNF